ncbi:hypothetical protein CC78DRAFT_146173 [Lojkania enalia]|uniref:Uncharacterized protein n=1 Tax=Lojkania enalia TaxID=147567 RepID=A0A9P4MUQ5_9PLEO|nr:hypothetical protein CC78DRAFT_146173 [Didymosphaeria enalia]
MLNMVELFSLLGFPARVGGRALLASRYISSGFTTVRVTSEYAEQRFGRSVRWRPWLMIDVQELEEIEELINKGSDAQLESWRVSQLSVCGMIAIIGALVAQAGLTALQLPSLEDVHYIARGAFIMSIILSLMAVFFSGLQQSSFGRASDPREQRLWLSSSVRWNEAKMKAELRSSIVAHMILQAPFEIVVMSITLFVVGFGVYLGSSWKAGLKLNEGDQGNRAVLIAYIIPTAFTLLMYGHMMGLKDRELRKTGEVDIVQEMSADLKLEGSPANFVYVGGQRESKRFDSMPNTEDMNVRFDGLRMALKEAAEAHRRSAKADEEVARQYERLLEVR